MCFQSNPVSSHCVPLATRTVPSVHPPRAPAERDLWYKRRTSFEESEAYVLGQNSLLCFCQVNVKPGSSTDSHRIKLQGRKSMGYTQETGSEHRPTAQQPVLRTHTTRAQLLLTTEWSLYLPLLPPFVVSTTTVYARSVGMACSLHRPKMGGFSNIRPK